MYTEIYSERAADAWSPIEAEEIADGIVDDAEVEATVQHLRAKKAERLERLKLFAGHVERYFVALYDLAGCPELAQRLRKSGRG